MARDSISKSIPEKQKDKNRDDLAKRTQTSEEIDAEEELLKNTEKVKPIKADKAVGRNDPCPCGSGKKFKKCCALKA